MGGPLLPRVARGATCASCGPCDATAFHARTRLPQPPPLAACLTRAVERRAEAHRAIVSQSLHRLCQLQRERGRAREQERAPVSGCPIVFSSSDAWRAVSGHWQGCGSPRSTTWAAPPRVRARAAPPVPRAVPPAAAFRRATHSTAGLLAERLRPPLLGPRRPQLVEARRLDRLRGCHGDWWECVRAA